MVYSNNSENIIEKRKKWEFELVSFILIFKAFFFFNENFKAISNNNGDCHNFKGEDNDKRGKAHKLFESTSFILYLKELGVVLEIR